MTVERFVVGLLSTNCYVVASDEKEAVVIDPGDESEIIFKYIQDKNLKLKYIILTHAHFDHVNGANELAKKTKASICVHKNDVQLLLSGSSGGLFLGFLVKGEGITEKIFELEEGQVLKAGSLEFKVMHTPGHTSGSISVLVDNLLFSGDLLFEGSIGRTDLPGGSQDLLFKSLKEKIFPLDDSVIIYPGHGGKTTIGKEKRYNPFLQEL